MLMSCIHRAGVVCISNDGRKNGCHCKATRLCRTRSRRSISLDSSENGGPDIWIRLPRHKWSKSWSNIEDSCGFLKGKLYGHPFAGVLWERQFVKVSLELRWRTVPNGECLFVHRAQGFFLSENVDDIKKGWKRAEYGSHVEKLMKQVDLGERTSSLDHIYLGCTQRECKPNESVIEEYRTCSNHEYPPEQLKSHLGVNNFTQKRSRGPTIWGRSREKVRRTRL